MAGIGLRVHLRGDGLKRFRQACKALGESKARKAYSRALNHTNNKTWTQTKRALSQQVGLNQSRLISLGNMKRSRATVGDLTAKITSSGGTIPLKEFSARQFSYGVKAKPWGQSRRFFSAFIFAGTPTSGQPVAEGDVFKRKSAKSMPIKMLYGPSIPKEMVKGASANAWRSATVGLTSRIAHEVKVITKGVVS